MEERYIKLAYEKVHTSDIEGIEEINGVKYALPKSTNVFFGTENIVGDKFKVNDEKPEPKEISNKIYFKTNSNNLKFEIDYTNRLDLIQQITANAIVRIIINKATNLKVENYYINSVDNQIVIDSNDISFMQIEQIESTANHLILSNLSTNNTGNILMIRGYGSIESVGPVCERIGELGLLKIKSASKKDDKISIHIVSGKRAIDDYFEKSKIIDNLQSILNVNQSEILKKIKELKFSKSNGVSKIESNLELDTLNKSDNFIDENNQKEVTLDDTYEIKTSTLPSSKKDSENSKKYKDTTEVSEDKYIISEKLEEKVVEQTAEVRNLVEKVNEISKDTSIKNKLSEKAFNLTKFTTDVDGIHFIYKVFRNKNIQEIIQGAKEISNVPNYISILGFPLGDVSNFYVTRSKNLNIDLKNILEKINPKLFLKSSGNMYEVEGTVNTQNLATVMESFLLNIKN